MRIQRKQSEKIRDGLSTEDEWKADDNGLIKCWEVGRALGIRDYSLALRAKAGALPNLGTWKGGVDQPLTSGFKYGTFRYLATWQGLSGQDLDIDTETEPELVCTATKVKVIFTSDPKKYGTP